MGVTTLLNSFVVAYNGTHTSTVWEVFIDATADFRYSSSTAENVSSNLLKELGTASLRMHVFQLKNSDPESAENLREAVSLHLSTASLLKKQQRKNLLSFLPLLQGLTITTAVRR